MASLIGLEFTASSAIAPSSPSSVYRNDSIRCVRCGYRGCDLRVAGCGCSFHVRCMPLLTESLPLSKCPHCTCPSSEISLFPMEFHEIDEARKLAASSSSVKRGRKRKNSLISLDDSVDSLKSEDGKGSTCTAPLKMTRKITTEEKGLGLTECRTGRWTSEEMIFCDKLIAVFNEGKVPLSIGMKLNDFLATMLNSKQSRLTKKMKNAKLSSKTFTRLTCYLKETSECRDFSESEERFLLSIQDEKERAELKFRMQKEWREYFSSFCVSIGQQLDADKWLSSVEEMEKRVSTAKDAARTAWRKLMTGYALSQDSQNSDPGVFIERTKSEVAAAQNNEPLKPCSTSSFFNSSETDEFLALLNDDPAAGGKDNPPMHFLPEVMDEQNNWKGSPSHGSPFLSKIMAYIKRHNIPFEHIDVWVPSFTSGEGGGESQCRLCYAGSATADFQIPVSGKGPSEPMSPQNQYNLLAFGDYSQKFSFDVGCGLPGRVYESGIPTWETSVHNAPSSHFERSGGASQWGIKSLVGIPVPSPNVGRIVIVLYSRHNRIKDKNTIIKLSEEFTKLLPTPKWKLVVDVSHPSEEPVSVDPAASQEGNLISTQPKAESVNDRHISQIVTLLGEEMPSSPASPNAEHLSGFMSLRLLLLRTSHTSEEEEIVRTIVGSFSSYAVSGRSQSDIAVMLSRDFMFLKQSQLMTNMVPNRRTTVHHQHRPIHSQPSELSKPAPVNHQFNCIQSQPIKTEMSLSPTDPKFSFYSILQTPHSSSFQNSPTLTPIVPPSGNVMDTLSIVSN